jgi:hypothetical protein
MSSKTLNYGERFWSEKLGPAKSYSIEQKFHLIFSLIIYLGVSLAKFLSFAFESTIPDIRNRAGRFLGFTPSALSEDAQFPPRALFKLWHDKFPDARQKLHELIVAPCAHEMAVDESNKLIEHPALKIKLKSLTMEGVRDLLKPERIFEIYQESAPFIWSLLLEFTSRPNKYRRQMGNLKSSKATAWEDDDWDDDPNLPDDEPERTWKVPEKPEGFARSPAIVCQLSSSLAQ